MAEWLRGTVAANGLEVAYHRTGAGSGKPPLVLLHGYTDNGLCGTRLAYGLENDFDVLLPDARGHGHTVGPVEDMRIDLLAADVAAIIGALGLERPVLFGHSMGAMTALAAAANFPGLMRAAILEDPPFKEDDPFVLSGEERRLLESDAVRDLKFQQVPLAAKIAQCRADNPGWHEDEIVPWAESKGLYNPEIVMLREAFRSYAWREAVARAACPLLLIAGEPSKGVFVTDAMMQEAAQINPRCESAYIRGTGHSIHRDGYDETMRRVSEFLKRVS